MSVFKNIATTLLPAFCLLLSCAAPRSAFRESDARSAGFYSSVLRDTYGAPALAKRITVYRTAFQEKLVETGSIINYASINDESTRELVDYRPPRTGYRQDMYLVRVEDACNPQTWFYYSVWYRFDRDSLKMMPYGFGKAYLGTGHALAGTIYFHTALSVKEGATGPALRTAGKSQFYFVFDALSGDTLRVNRIVMEENNKFGGPRSYVFKVEDHFPHDLKRLSFRRELSQGP